MFARRLESGGSVEVEEASSLRNDAAFALVLGDKILKGRRQVSILSESIYHIPIHKIYMATQRALGRGDKILKGTVSMPFENRFYERYL